MHNVGHGYDGDFIVVDTPAEAKRRVAGTGLQEFSLIHDLAGGRIVPSRIVVQVGLPVKFYNTSLDGEERVSIDPFYLQDGPNIRKGAITDFKFSPDKVGEFTIRYDRHSVTATLVVDTVPFDVSGDGIVKVHDLGLVIANFGVPNDARADVTGDGLVDVRDLALVAINLG